MATFLLNQAVSESADAASERERAERYSVAAAAASWASWAAAGWPLGGRWALTYGRSPPAPPEVQWTSGGAGGLRPTGAFADVILKVFFDTEIHRCESGCCITSYTISRIRIGLADEMICIGVSRWLKQWKRCCSR